MSELATPSDTAASGAVPRGPLQRALGAATSWSGRLFGCCMAAAVLLAVMTGPEGSNAQPTSGITGSFTTGHVIGYLVAGVALWAGMVLWRTGRRGQSSGDPGWFSGTQAKVRSLYASTMSHARSRRITFGTGLVVLLALAVLAADFTGPYHPDKLSWPQLRHQFVDAYTYGYLAIALVLWWAISRWMLQQQGLAAGTRRPPRPVRAALIVAGCVFGALLFALAANPWLPPALSWSQVALVGRGSSIFGQWMTYLYLACGAVVAWRLLREPRGARAPGRARLSSSLRLTPAVALLAIFLAVETPRYMFSYWQGDLALLIGTYCLLAMGLNLVVGFCGLLDLGYVAFYAVGAYMAAYFTGALPVQPPFHLNLFIVLPIAVLAAMVAGMLLGLPTLRLRGDYLAIVTLVFGEIVEVLLVNWSQVTGGSQGTNYVQQFSVNFLGIHYAWNNAVVLPYYYLMLVFVIGAIYVFHSVNRSRVGRRWSAIREDEAAAASLGVNPLKYKVMAFAIGASTAGIAGAFTASNLGVLIPSGDTFGLQISILILALVLFGGMGSILGVLGGAAIFQWAVLDLQLHPIFGYNQADEYMWVGTVLIVLMIFRPKGLFPSRQRSRELALARAGAGSADPMQVEREEPTPVVVE